MHHICSFHGVTGALPTGGHQNGQGQNCPQWDTEILWTQFKSSIIQVAYFIKTMYTNPNTQYIPDKWIVTHHDDNETEFIKTE